MTATPAPTAPGALGATIGDKELCDWLTQIVSWRDNIKTAIAEIDERAQKATVADSLTADVTLTWALWKAASDRIDTIVEVWDSGRISSTETANICTLIWGRVDGGGIGGLSACLDETCRLLVALYGALEERLETDALGRKGVGDRIGSIRRQHQHCVATAHASNVTVPHLQQLGERIENAVAQAQAGGDVGVELDQLGDIMARTERDVIVAAAIADGVVKDVEHLTTLVERLTELATEIRTLAGRALERIAHLRPLAIPNPHTLEPIPDVTDATTIEGWKERRVLVGALRDRAQHVRAAMRHAYDHYHTPLARREELRGLLGAYRSMSGHHGTIEDPDTQAAYDQARQLLWTAPCDLDVAARLVDTYRQIASTRVHNNPHPTTVTSNAPSDNPRQENR